MTSGRTRVSVPSEVARSSGIGSRETGAAGRSNGWTQPHLEDLHVVKCDAFVAWLAAPPVVEVPSAQRALNGGVCARWRGALPRSEVNQIADAL
jgi:hypothetical protein